jgi:chromosome segregation ATPase
MQQHSPDRYKRRFLVEFTPNESDLLDRLGLSRGTKRRAILDGLRLLESGELETLRGSVAELERERDAVAAAAATHLAEMGGLRDERKASAGQLREARAEIKSAKADLREVNQDLADVRQDLTSVQAEARRLATLVPHHAFCAACGKYVSESEWAEQAAEKGVVHVYHKPHGYRPKASVTQYPSVLFWRSMPPEAAT